VFNILIANKNTMYTETCRDWHEGKTPDRLTIGFIKYLERKIHRYLSKYTFVLRSSERLFSLFLLH